ncbi:EAL domain-containing protein [Neptuniibacter sp. QD48_11]|uniref:EAL domain-containing protein n=1 Tax=unclassified Neptuniibacter TaxID=2630693 RepID=UPI0039F4F989
MKKVKFSTAILSIVLCALTVIALVLLIPAYQGSQRALLEEINLSHSRNQTVLQQFFYKYLKAAAFNAEQISQRDILKTGIENQHQKDLNKFLQQQLAGQTGESIHAFVLETQQGNHYEFINTSLLGMQLNLSELTKEFIPNRSWKVQSVSHDTATPLHLMRITFPIISDDLGEVIGTLHSFILLNDHFKLLSEIQSLTGAESVALYFNQQVTSSLALTPKLLSVLQQSKPDTLFEVFEDDRIIHHYQLSFNTQQQLKVVATLPNSSILALELAYTKDLGMAITAALIIGLLTVLAISRLTKTSLVRLVQYAEDMAINRDAEPFKPGHFSEFNLLGKTLEHMVGRISEHEQQLNGIITNTPNIIFIKGADLRYQMISPNYYDLIKDTSIKVIGKTDHELYSPKHAEILKSSDLEVIRTSTPIQIEYTGATELGRRNYLSTKFPLFDESGNVYAIGGIVTDVTDLKHAQSHIQLAGQIFDQADEAILVIDTHLKMVTSNSACHQLCGSDDLTINQFSRRFFAEHPDIRHSLKQDKRWQGETQIRRPNGQAFPAWLSVSNLYTEDNEERFVLIFSDISAKKEAENKLEKLSHYDGLTGLPNRSLFFDRLNSAIARSNREKSQIGLLFINIDRFKNINDTYGHAAGDELLKATANRISGFIRPDDTVSRLGGDEFGVILQSIDNVDTVSHISHRIIESLRTPFQLDNFMSNAPVSIGIALYPDDGKDAKELLTNADTAMYHMKEKGRNGILFYDQEVNQKAEAQTRLEEDLRLALHNQDIFLVYQPRFHINGKDILSAEALARWNHPEKGMIPPGQFIELAEQTGLIVELGREILNLACHAAKAWNLNPARPMPVSVNLSARQIYDPNLIDDIKGALIDSDLAPSLLELEITETLAIDDLDKVINKLQQICDLGVSLSVDDFGTGYSSLIYLKRLPVSTVKIDRSFVTGVPGDTDDENIIAAIISMSHSLQLKVVAEGVETQEQLSFLKDHQCDEIQGFLLGKPDSSTRLLEYAQKSLTS